MLTLGECRLKVRQHRSVAGNHRQARIAEPLEVLPAAMRATAVGLALLLAHLLGDAAAPSIIGLISDRASLGAALMITGPTFLFLAGLVCLIGLKTVAKDMRRMQEQVHK